MNQKITLIILFLCFTIYARAQTTLLPNAINDSWKVNFQSYNATDDEGYVVFSNGIHSPNYSGICTRDYPSSHCSYSKEVWKIEKTHNSTYAYKLTAYVYSFSFSPRAYFHKPNEREAFEKLKANAIGKELYSYFIKYIDEKEMHLVLDSNYINEQSVTKEVIWKRKSYIEQLQKEEIQKQEHLNATYDNQAKKRDSLITKNNFEAAYQLTLKLDTLPQGLRNSGLGYQNVQANKIAKLKCLDGLKRYEEVLDIAIPMSIGYCSTCGYTENGEPDYLLYLRNAVKELHPNYKEEIANLEMLKFVEIVKRKIAHIDTPEREYFEITIWNRKIILAGVEISYNTIPDREGEKKQAFMMSSFYRDLLE